MKKKVKMTCILKNGHVIKDSFPVKRSDTQAIKVIEQIRLDVENYLIHPENAGCLTFGKSSILMSEIAAISFK